MEIEFDIEWKNELGEFEVIEVKFEAFPKYEDDSYDDEFGTVKLQPRPIVDEDATWDKTIYNEQQNTIIQNWVNTHYDYIEDKFCREFEKQSQPDY